MERLPILYYRKLKNNAKVFIPSLQTYVMLYTNYPSFIGITQYCLPLNVYFGFLESTNMTAEASDRCELEVNEESFVDDCKYTKEDVNKILHPILYGEPIYYNPF